jgi:hypothetical protein
MVGSPNLAFDTTRVNSKHFGLAMFSPLTQTIGAVALISLFSGALAYSLDVATLANTVLNEGAPYTTHCFRIHRSKQFPAHNECRQLHSLTQLTANLETIHNLFNPKDYA